MNADELDSLTERVLGAVFEVYTRLAPLIALTKHPLRHPFMSYSP
jgi:hypothetical protein